MNERTVNDVIIASGITVSRNLESTPFPHRLNSAGITKICRSLASQLLDGAPDLRPVDFGALQGWQAAALAEKGVVTPEFFNERENRVLFLSADEKQAVMLCEEAHLVFRFIAEGNALDAVSNDAYTLERELAEKIDYAFSPRLGFLMADPEKCGTGMVCDVTMQLPALAWFGQIEQTADATRKLGLELKPALYEPRGGSMYILTNTLGLGIDEKQAITNLSALALQLADLERSFAEGIASDPEFANRLAAAKHRLLEADELTATETRRLLSVLRLASLVGMESYDIPTLDRLMISILPGMMSGQAGYRLDRETRDRVRPVAVRRTLRPNSNN